MIYLVLALAFTSGFLLVFGINLFLADIAGQHHRQIEERLEGELRAARRERARNLAQHQDLSRLAAEGHAEMDGEMTSLERFHLWLDQSGVEIHISQLVLLCVISAALPAALVMLVFRSPISAALVAGTTVGLPLAYTAWRRRQRQEKLRAQLPDAFDLMSRVLRAGQTISQAVQGVADEFAPPISEEFAYCYEQQNLGLSTELTLRDLARRTGLLEMKIFVVSLLVHRQTGGNLSEILDNLSVVIRDRFRIRGQIRAFTAEGRLQAVLLLALPPCLLGVLMIINRSYVSSLFEFPLLLVGMFVFEVIGALWLRKIINFDF